MPRCSPSDCWRSALAAVSLQQATEEDVAAVVQRCVFTTHTPVPAGHDQFGTDQKYAVLGIERGKPSNVSDACTMLCST